MTLKINTHEMQSSRSCNLVQSVKSLLIDQILTQKSFVAEKHTLYFTFFPLFFSTSSCLSPCYWCQGYLLLLGIVRAPAKCIHVVTLT